jgi:hypothetical protein
MQVALSHLNKIYGDREFLREHRDELLELFRPSSDPEQALENMVGTAHGMLSGQGLVNEAMKGADPSEIARLLQGVPPTILEAQRAVVYRNLQRAEPFGITVAWAPGYDSELTVWESPPTTISPGWITTLIKTRYPSDDHPVPGKGMSEQWG